MVGESDVVLDERRVLEPRSRQFFPTFTEWVADGNAEQVFVTSRSLASSTTIYTVPDNYSLFVTSCWISATEEDNVSIHAFASIGKIEGATVTDFLGVNVDHITGQHGGATAGSQSFPMPLKIQSGERMWITLDNFSNGNVSGGFQGFLLPKKISIR
jgi:hypothetical protein